MFNDNRNNQDVTEMTLLPLHHIYHLGHQKQHLEQCQDGTIGLRLLQLVKSFPLR